MPLIKSGSERARNENIKREIEAGKPIKQAVAIGYSVQREAEGKPEHVRRHEEREAHERHKYGR